MGSARSVALPSSLIGVVELGGISPAYAHPVLTEDRNLVLEEGEHILERVYATINVGTNHLPSTQFVLTDRRLVWINPDVAKGHMTFGLGLIGAPVALAASAASYARARRRRKGRSVVGQVRYEWLLGMSLLTQSSSGLIVKTARTHSTLMLIIATANGGSKMSLSDLSEEATARLVPQLSTSVASRWLTTGRDLLADPVANLLEGYLEELPELMADSTPERSGRMWTLPSAEPVMSLTSRLSY